VVEDGFLDDLEGFGRGWGGVGRGELGFDLCVGNESRKQKEGREEVSSRDPFSRFFLSLSWAQGLTSFRTWERRSDTSLTLTSDSRRAEQTSFRTASRAWARRESKGRGQLGARSLPSLFCSSKSGLTLSSTVEVEERELRAVFRRRPRSARTMLEARKRREGRVDGVGRRPRWLALVREFRAVGLVSASFSARRANFAREECRASYLSIKLL